MISENSEIYNEITSILMDYKLNKNQELALLMSIKAVKKEFPIKPIESEDGSEVRCPTCISKIYDNKWTNLDNLKHKHNICVYCGQRLTRVCGNGKWR